MYKLRRLILCDNEILDLTNELGNLVSLEEFDISKNGEFSFRSQPGVGISGICLDEYGSVDVGVRACFVIPLFVMLMIFGLLKDFHL